MFILKKIVVVFFLMFFSSSVFGGISGINFQADYVEWFGKSSLIIGRGKVSVEYENVKLEADSIKLNLKEFELWAEGEVSLQIDNRSLKGKSIKFNLETKRGEILSCQGKEGPIFYQAEQVYLTSKIMELSEAEFTTCDLSPPHYKIKARTIELDLEKELVTARDAVLYVGKYPLFWMPVIVRYLHEENTMMFPSVGYTDFAGWYVETGYHFYTSPSLQATLRLGYREKKGWSGGVDSFYTTKAGEGELKTYFIKEKDTQNERWRLKLNHKYSFSKFTSLKVNFDRVSDEEFLKDYFPEEDEEVSPSFLSLDYQKEGHGINFLLEPEVNPFKFEESIQRLPQVTLDFPAQEISKTGFYLSKGAQVVNFQKEEKGLIRADCFLDLYYPFTVFKHFEIEPKLGYHLFGYKDKEGKEGYRKIPYQEFQASFQVDGGSKEKWTYSLKPGLGYYHSTEEKNDFTFPFELEDYEKKTEDIHPPNLVKLGIKNYFYYKEKHISSGNISLGYNLIEGKKGFSFLEGEFHLTPPLPFLNYIDLYFLYDYYNGEYEKIKNNFDFKGESWHLNLEMEKDVDEDINDFAIQGDINLGKKWNLSAYGSYDFEKEEISKETYSVTRDLHCWSVKFSYQSKPQVKYSIMFYINAFLDE